MPLNEEDPDFPATITVIALLKLLFGREVTYYYANPQRCPARLRYAYESMKNFEELIEKAVSPGKLKIVHPGTKFCSHSLERKEVFLWIHHKRILMQFEDQGLVIDEDVKKGILDYVKREEEEDEEEAELERLKIELAKAKAEAEQSTSSSQSEGQAQSESESTVQVENEQVKSGVVPPEKSVREPVDSKAFVRTLKFCYYEPYVFISKAGKRAVPFTLRSIGFHSPSGIQAEDFIGILTERDGPEYGLGASHSYAGGRGQNIQDIASDRTIEYLDDKARDSRKSTALSSSPQKIENSDYRKKKTRLEDIDEKIRKFIEKEFSVNLGKKFKLYEKLPDKGSGIYRFKFQTKTKASLNNASYSSISAMDERKTLKELERVSSIDNEDALDDLMKFLEHANEIGISQDKIDLALTPRKDLKE